MSKKVIGIVLVIMLIAVATGVFYYFYEKQTKIKVPIISQITGKTNNFENYKLLEIAKQHILSKPQIYLNRDKFVNWDSAEMNDSLAKSDLGWIISHKAGIWYTPKDFYKSTTYQDLNDKFIVSWFFIPGCEENPKSFNKPNWFNKSGLGCLGGYNLDVIINPDGTVNHAELNALL